MRAGIIALAVGAGAGLLISLLFMLIEWYDD